MRRLLEDKPLPRTMPEEERERIIERIAAELIKHGEILLAVVYGGFTRRKMFRDIDVAVYTAGKVSYRDEPYYTYTLSLHLTKLTGIRVDVKLLDYAPPSFRIAVLESGRLLFSRLPGLRSSLLIRARDELRGLTRTRRQTRQTPGPPPGR